MRSHLKLIAFITAIIFALSLTAIPVSAVVSPNGNYTADEAGVLSEKTKDYITERNYNLEANCKGAQICVVTVRSVGREGIESYASALFEKWKIGRSGEDNGVLLLMAIDDKDYYILPGTGLNSAFDTKTVSDMIRNNLEPFFGDGDYDGAAKETFRKLNEVVCRFYGADPSGYAGGSGFTGGGSGRHGKGSGLSSCSSSGSSSAMQDGNIGISCNSCGGALFLGCVACVGYELFSSMGD